MDSKRISKGLPQTHRQPDQPASKRLPLPAHQENLMQLQGVIGNQAVQRMIQRQIEMDEMEVPVESEAQNPIVMDEMEVPVQGGSDESGAKTGPDGVVEFPTDYGPDVGPTIQPDNTPGVVGPTVGPDNIATPKDSADDSGAVTRPDGVVEFPPDHGPDWDGKGSGPATPQAPKGSSDDSGAKTRPDGVVEFPEDHVPAEGEPTVGPDGTLEFPPDHVPSSDEGGSWMDNLPFF